MGHLYGLFVAEKEEVDNLIGKTVYFGDVLGKHSDVYAEMEEGYFSVISDDQELISRLLYLFNSNTMCGYNPVVRYEEYEEEDEDE